MQDKSNFLNTTKLLLALNTLYFIGCSPFSNKPDRGSVGGENAFRPVAIAITNEPAVPAEIANDIKAISEGRAPAASNWQSVTPPEVSPNPLVKNGEAENKESFAHNIAVTKAEEKPPGGENTLGAMEEETAKNANKSGKRFCKKKDGNCTEKYRVKIGDTLMKISFEKYGSLFRWREIYERNRDQIKSFNILSVGMTLTIEGVEYLVIEKNGEPYLIRKQDTLAKISNKLYGTPTKWKALWKNNLQLIHNPNKIYAGLTLYYQPDISKGQMDSGRVPTSLPKK